MDQTHLFETLLLYPIHSTPAVYPPCFNEGGNKGMIRINSGFVFLSHFYCREFEIGDMSVAHYLHQLFARWIHFIKMLPNKAYIWTSE